MNKNSEKIDATKMYLAMAFLKECNYDCGYCDPFGESKITHGKNMNFNEFKQVIDASYVVGFRTFRFTGGECTIVPWFQDAVAYVAGEHDGVRVNICTNGSLLEKHLDVLSKYKDNVSLRISLDSIDPTKRNFGIRKVLTPDLDKVLHQLKDIGIYTRFNTVVTQKNLDQVEDIIKYASELKMDVKLLDMYVQDKYIATHGKNGLELKSDPLEYWKDNYVDLNILRPILEKRADKILPHYNKDGGFGIPMYAYDMDGITVIFKDSTGGAYFNKKHCIESCALFGQSCQEGVYTPHVSSNMVMHINGCHNTKYQWDLRNKTREEQENSFYQILDLFQDLVHVTSPPANIIEHMQKSKVINYD